MKRLVLVDALALMYRSFFAIRELSTEAGRPTNAVYGFIRKLQSLRKEMEPSHWAVVFDGGLPARRMRLLREYKAQRPPMPHGLREQLPVAESYLDAARIPHIRMEEEEADDVMASIVRWGEPDAEDIFLVSNDKDLFQLVSETTRILPPAGKLEIMDPARVEARTGVKPEQVIDWLAMVGDTADNIPGLPGIGPKTAAKLLNTYGSLSELLAHLDELPAGKPADILRGHHDLLERNVELVRLHTDVGRQWAWDELCVRTPDAKQLLTLFDELEFKNLARDIREPELFG